MPQILTIIVKYVLVIRSFRNGRNRSIYLYISIKLYQAALPGLKYCGVWQESLKYS